MKPKKDFKAEVVVILNTLKSAKRAEYNAGRAVCELFEVTRVHYKVIDHNKDARVGHGERADEVEADTIQRLEADRQLRLDEDGNPICPQIFIDGNLIGDADDVQELVDEKLLLDVAKRQVCMACRQQRNGEIKCKCGATFKELMPNFMTIDDACSKKVGGQGPYDSSDSDSEDESPRADTVKQAPVSGQEPAKVEATVLPSAGRKQSWNLSKKRQSAVDQELAMLEKVLGTEAPPPPPMATPPPSGNTETAAGPPTMSMRIMLLSKKTSSDQVPIESMTFFSNAVVDSEEVVPGIGLDTVVGSLMSTASDDSFAAPETTKVNKPPPKQLSPLSGHLWKKSPNMMRLSSWDWRYVVVHKMHLYYYKSQSEAPPLHLIPEDGGPNVKGIIDFRKDLVEVDGADVGGSTFTLKPSTGQWGEHGVKQRASTKGRTSKVFDKSRIFNFDTKDSEFNRWHWVAHIRSHLRAAEALEEGKNTSFVAARS